MVDTASQQITDGVIEFINKTMPLPGCHALIAKMSSLTYNFLAGTDPSPILDPSMTAHAFRNFRSFRTKLGFAFPKPDGLMSVDCGNGVSWTIFIYLEDKMKLLKVRILRVDIQQRIIGP